MLIAYLIRDGSGSRQRNRRPDALYFYVSDADWARLLGLPGAGSEPDLRAMRQHLPPESCHLVRVTPERSVRPMKATTLDAFLLRGATLLHPPATFDDPAHLPDLLQQRLSASP